MTHRLQAVVRLLTCLGAAWLLLGVSPSASNATASAAPAPAAASVPYRASAPTRGALASDGVDGRYLLGGAWLTRPDPSLLGARDGWWRGVASTAGWSPVSVPNSYNVGNYSAASMSGSVQWYRRDFLLPRGAFARYASATARAWTIQFESVNYVATVWLNGHELGAHTGAYLPFTFVLQGLRAGVNRLIVRVDDRRDATSFPHAGNLWWNFGGILDAVYLIPTQAVQFTDELIRPVLRCPTCAATIDEQVTVENDTARPERIRLSGRYGPLALSFGAQTLAPGTSWTASAARVLAHPDLWAPGSPHLYRATLTVSDADGRPLDGFQYLSGVRQITVGSDGLMTLNGRRMNLRGVNIHEQDGTTGEALSLPQLRQIIAWVRSLHATIIRAHYPLDPELEQLADEDGILLWSEIPVYQTPNTYLSQPAYRARAVSLLQTDIADNEDHPSILLWSIGNELPTPPPSGEAAYIAQAAAAAHAADPTRPVGMAISDWPGIPCQSAYAPLDVIGVNEYFGWFGAGGGTTDDSGALGPFLDSLRACYPHQALMITEFGFDGNRSGPAEAYGTYGFQSAGIADHLATFATKPYLAAVMYYNLRDFAARPGWDGGNPLGTPPFVTNGLVDFTGSEKPAFGEVSASFAATDQLGPAP